MRSFNLSQLESVSCMQENIAWHIREFGDTTRKAPILSKDGIMENYNIDENSLDNKWPYTFSVKFIGRNFDLACRTI